MAVKGGLPSGVVTFLFTDVEGSTQIWEDRPVEMEGALAAHDEIVRRTIEACGGYVFSTQGDSFAAAFERPDDAVAAACSAQQELHAAELGPDLGLRIRIGLHAGTAEERDDDYFGRSPTRAARIMSAAHGGQVLMSDELVRLAGDLAVTDLGEFRLRDLRRPVRLFELDCGLEQSFPPPRTADVEHGNLPRRLTSFVGRTDELRELTLRLADARLITLVGAGGTGKTRLALELAERMQDGFGHGAWLVELGRVRSGLGIDEATLTALDAPSGTGPPPRERLVNHLAPRRALVVVDNCEHVIDSAASMVSEILERCPDVVVVATSREPLVVDGEHVVVLDPLPVDAGEGSEPSLAAELFVERARTEGADLTDADVTDIEELCRRLDGMPLAIELAAGRARSLPPDRMLTLLDDRFRLLSRGRRTAEQRHQTLRATVAWSYELLPPVEQLVFDRLSVFVGSFDTAAAVAVAVDDHITELDVIDALTSLHDKSMCASDAAPDGHRYRLLETLRVFGRANLETRGERHEMRLRHARHHADLVSGLSDEVFGGDEYAAALRVASLAPELRAAVERCAAHGEQELIEALMVPLRPFTWRSWYEPSYWIADVELSLARADWVLDLLFLHAFIELDTERGRALIDELESRTPDGSSVLVVSHVFASLFALTMLGESVTGRRHAEAAAQMARTAAADRVEQIMGEFASVVVKSSSGEDALSHADRMVERARAVSWPTGECFGLFCRGLAVEPVDPDEAEPRYLRARELAVSHRSTEVEGIATMRLLLVRVGLGWDGIDLAPLAMENLRYWMDRSNWINLRSIVPAAVVILEELGRGRSAVLTLGALEGFDGQLLAAEERFQRAKRAALDAVGDEAESLLEHGRHTHVREITELILQDLSDLIDAAC